MAQKHFDDISRGNLISYLTPDDQKFLNSIYLDYAKSQPELTTLQNETQFRTRLNYISNFTNKIGSYFNQVQQKEGSNDFFGRIPARKIGAYQQQYQSLYPIDQEIRKYQLLNIDTGSSGFEAFRANVLVPAASIAADAGAVATVAGAGFAAYTAVSAALTTNAAIAASLPATNTVGAGTIAGAEGLLGSTSLAVPFSQATATVGVVGSAGAASTGIAGLLASPTAVATITGAGTLLESEGKKLLNDLMGPKKEEAQINAESVAEQKPQTTSQVLPIAGAGLLALLFLL